MVQKTFMWKGRKREWLNRVKNTRGTKIGIQGLESFCRAFYWGKGEGVDY